MMDSYVAVDLETTGLGPQKDKVIEIGMVKVRNGEASELYHTLVDPCREIPENITALTGIDGAMVQGAPNMDETVGTVLAFCEGFPLLGHQVRFDYGFLAQAAANRNLSFPKEGIDTLKLCRLLMPAGEKKNLRAACAYFGIHPDSSHRALSDAMAAHKLYEALKNRYGEGRRELFEAQRLQYKVKKEKPASKRQKQYLQDFIKYHRIDVTVQIDHMSGNEISRMIDKLILQHGRIPAAGKEEAARDKFPECR